MNLLDLMVKVGFDDNASAKVSALGNSIKSHLGTAAITAAKGCAIAIGSAVTATVAGVAAIGTQALTAYASYEQLVGGVETLFGTSASKLETYAANAYKNQQMSANDYMETATSFSATLIQSLGGDTDQAVEYANKAVTQMSDNSSKMGTSIDEVQRAYQSMARGNYAMLDSLKLGYGGTKSEMERLLEDAEKISGVHYEMGNFADLIDAIGVVQDELGITGTTAEEAQHTIEGSVNMAKAAYTNWITGLADDNANIEELTNELVDSVIVAAENVIPRVGQIMGALGDAFVEYAPEVAAKLGSALQDIISDAMSNMGFDDSEISAVFDTLEGAFENVKGVIESELLPAWENFTRAFNDVDWSPFIEAGITQIELFIDIVVIAVSAVLGIVADIMDLISTVQDLGTAFGEAPGKIQELINSLANDFATALTNAGTAVSNFVNSVITWFTNLVMGVWTAITTFVNNIISGFTNASNQGKSIVNGLIQAVINFFNTLPGAIAAILAAVINSVVAWASNMASAAASAASQFVSRIRSGLSGVAGAVSGALSSAASAAWTWGSHIASNIASGIRSAIGSVSSAASALAATVKNYLHFTEPDIGPLSDFHTYMPDMIDMLVSGMADGEKSVAQAAEGIAENIQSGLGVDTLGNIDWESNVKSGNAFDGVDFGNSSVVNAITYLHNDLQSIIETATPDGLTSRQFSRLVKAAI